MFSHTHTHHLLRIPIEQRLSRRGWQTDRAGSTLSTIFLPSHKSQAPQTPITISLKSSSNPPECCSLVQADQWDRSGSYPCTSWWQQEEEQRDEKADILVANLSRALCSRRGETNRGVEGNLEDPQDYWAAANREQKTEAAPKQAPRPRSRVRQRGLDGQGGRRRRGRTPQAKPFHEWP